jgi:hypothetical protein
MCNIRRLSGLKVLNLIVLRYLNFPRVLEILVSLYRNTDIVESHSVHVKEISML